jgi:hypothetical protein
MDAITAGFTFPIEWIVSFNSPSYFFRTIDTLLAGECFAPLLQVTAAAGPNDSQPNNGTPMVWSPK